MKAEMEELKAIPNKQPEMREQLLGCPVGSVGKQVRISGLFHSP